MQVPIEVRITIMKHVLLLTKELKMVSMTTLEARTIDKFCNNRNRWL